MTEHEASFHVDGYRVHVNKVGGGTVGEKYTGYWEAEIVNSLGDVVWSTGSTNSEKICTGLFKTHKQVAWLAVQYHSEA